jgi:hypothetical protein
MLRCLRLDLLTLEYFPLGIEINIKSLEVWSDLDAVTKSDTTVYKPDFDSTPDHLPSLR